MILYSVKISISEDQRCQQGEDIDEHGDPLAHDLDPVSGFVTREEVGRVLVQDVGAHPVGAKNGHVDSAQR